MKKTLFTHAGGFPLTQDRLAVLQSAYEECLLGLAQMGGSTGPFVISGCLVTRVLAVGTVYNYSITAGWIYYNGEMLRISASGPIGIDESVAAPYILITNSSTILTYNDSSTFAAETDDFGVIWSEPIGTADDATKFAWAHLLPFGRESAETNLAVATGPGAGTVLGNIWVRKNILNNTLQVRGVLITGSPSDFAAWPATSTILLQTLPLGYRPTAYRWAFNVGFPKGGSMIKDINGTYFNHMNGSIGTDGQITIDFIKPDAGITLYGAEFDFIMSLD